MECGAIYLIFQPEFPVSHVNCTHPLSFIPRLRCPFYSSGNEQQEAIEQSQLYRDLRGP